MAIERTVLGRPVSPLTRRRIDNFKANRRGFGSLLLFLGLFGVSLGAEFIANDKPLLLRYQGRWHVPVLKVYAEAEFGGIFQTEADYRSAELRRLVETEGGGWMLWPPIRYAFDTYKKDIPAGMSAPTPPRAGDNWLGTDDQARDVLAGTAAVRGHVAVIDGIVAGLQNSNTNQGDSRADDCHRYVQQALARSNRHALRRVLQSIASWPDRTARAARELGPKGLEGP